jgi:hypothetical protein
MARSRTLSPEARGYLEAALWSSNDESDESGGEPLDRNYDIEDIAPETLDQMIGDVEDFVADNRHLLELTDLARGRIGHDFWLTRNSHGSGFWDEGLGRLGDDLTKASHAYGSYYLYVGDDGQIHGSDG